MMDQRFNLNVKKVLQFALYFVINGLFVYKYVSRTNYNPMLLLIVYIIGLLLSYFLLYKPIVERINNRTRKNTFWLVVSFAIVGISVLHILIDPYSVEVDRWSAINNFWVVFFNGEYPYLAQTHLGGYGSPFPVWQLFHLLFYLLGDVGYAFVFVFIILSIALVYVFKSFKVPHMYLFFLLLSPAFWYEVLVRSDLLYNFILLFVLILLFNAKQISFQNHYLKIAIACGLLLSTRLSVVIPIGIFFMTCFFELRNTQKLLFLAIVSISFILTFLPLIFWDFNSLLFFEYNPFVLQSRQGSWVELIVLVLILLGGGFYAKGNFDKYCFATSLGLTLFISVTFLHLMMKDNFLQDIFSPRYDITYFNMALPFIIYTLANELKLKS